MQCYRIAAVGLGLLGILTAGDLAAEVATVDVPGGVRCWCLDSDSGRVFAALQQDPELRHGVVREYEPGGKNVREFSVGRGPRDLVIKRGRLVVSCEDRNELHFVDLRENKVVGSLPFAELPVGLCGSRANNSFVYCFSNSVTDRTLFQIDVATRKVLHAEPLIGWKRDPVFDAAVSGDGGWMIVQRGRTDPRDGVSLFVLNEAEFQISPRRHLPQQLGRPSVGPHDRRWLFGPKAVPLDLKSPIREYRGTVCALHPLWALLARAGN